MATYAWTLTRENLAARILRKLGVIGGAESPEPEDSATVNEAIDARLKELHALGVLWWNVSGAQTTVTLVGGTATATISPSDYLLPLSMLLVVGTEQQPIRIIGHLQYQAIPDKAKTGEPEVVFIDGVTCRFWPVPASSGSAKLTYQAIAADTEHGTAVDVPAAMLRALSDVVAADLVDEYEPPPQKTARLLAKQPLALRTLRMLKREHVDTAPVEAEYF
jgi:hypothetical protein